jgi:hypothetical protein
MHATNGRITGTERKKSKSFPNREKTRTIRAMNSIIQFEDKVSRSRSKREGESSQDVCDRLDLTRDDSQRQLPTDHDYAVSTREYQLDQSSPLPASAAADPVFERQRRKTNPRIRGYIDRVTPYQRPLWGISLVHEKRGGLNRSMQHHLI